MPVSILVASKIYLYGNLVGIALGNTYVDLLGRSFGCADSVILADIIKVGSEKVSDLVSSYGSFDDTNYGNLERIVPG